MQDFFERIKPVARSRGIISFIGNTKDVWVRDVVISANDLRATKLKAHAHAIAAAYRSGTETSPHPYLSILHLGGGEQKERLEGVEKKVGVFSVKEKAYDHDGYWPLSESSKWDLLDLKAKPLGDT